MNETLCDSDGAQPPSRPLYPIFRWIARRASQAIHEFLARLERAGEPDRASAYALARVRTTPLYPSTPIQKRDNTRHRFYFLDRSKPLCKFR
ncbi:MAG: hypothetical protein GC154_11980 [bacterium]|nr:hypothetical protein [bacterium]